MMNWKVCRLFFHLCIILRCSSLPPYFWQVFLRGPHRDTECRCETSYFILMSPIATVCRLCSNVKKFYILPHTLCMFRCVLAVNRAVESLHKTDSLIFKSPAPTATPTPSWKLNMYYLTMLNLLKWKKKVSQDISSTPREWSGYFLDL
jgi:hypothetical protein